MAYASCTGYTQDYSKESSKSCSALVLKKVVENPSAFALAWHGISFHSIEEFLPFALIFPALMSNIECFLSGLKLPRFVERLVIPLLSAPCFVEWLVSHSALMSNIKSLLSALNSFLLH